MSARSPVVLIAEDNPGLARVLSFKFAASGFSPIVCSDGQLAWETFQTRGVAAIVSDHEMPEMSGIELCRRVRSVDRSLPFFLVTGRQLELDSAGVEPQWNIKRIFGKPFSPAEMTAAVGAAIEAAQLQSA
jgi:DNA-binding response OmpR family regulator